MHVMKAAVHACRLHGQWNSFEECWTVLATARSSPDRGGSAMPAVTALEAADTALAEEMPVTRRKTGRTQERAEKGRA